MLKHSALRSKAWPMMPGFLQLTVRNYSRPTAAVNTLQGMANRSVNASWSSPQDRILRNVFSSDYVHAWTLLEACLEHGNMQRAESVLLGLTEISGPTDITLAVNTYLQRLVDSNPGRPHVAVEWLRKLEYQIPRFRANDVTEALMLRNACVSAETYPNILESQIAKYKRTHLLAILKQFELLGGEGIQKVLEVGRVSKSELDQATRKALNAWTKGRTAEAETPSNLSGRMQSTLSIGGGKIADPIKKEGYEPLEPTQSPGLVGIRHVLTALQRKSHIDQRNLTELTELAELPHVQNKSADELDFFDIWKQLKTDEEKQKFDKLLEAINERRQRNVETRGVEAARMRWRLMFEQMAEADRSGSSKVQLKGLETLLWEWNQAMLPLVESEVARLRVLAQYSKLADVPAEVIQEHFPGMKQKTLSERFEYAPYLSLAKPENLPAMTMMELLRLNSNSRDSVRSVTAIVSVGKNVEREYKLEIRKRNMKKSGKRNKLVAAAAQDPVQKSSAKLSRSSSDTINLTHSWPATVRAKIGSLLISHFMQVARVPVTGTDPVSGKRIKSKAPAFHHSYQYQNGNKIGVLRPHKVLANYLSGERTAIQPQQLPMLCKPRPWTSWDSGGYWYTPSTIIRSKDSPEQVAYIAAASERGQIQRVFDGLNVLGETAWTVNKPIFKVLSQIWNSKEEFLDIPPHVPPLPDLSVIPAPPRDTDPGELRDYRRKCRALTLENGRLYSQRCDLNYKLDIARALLGERFYMPHNVDFRGRAYPLSPHFNHLGNDISRSLLIFWEGRKLGPRGLWWLKVHLANLFGVNKSSHDERVQFVDENMDKLMDSAKDPLSARGSWWKQAGDGPFQALATCMEIKNALEHPEGHENYESHLTVHQDGSCNGLQHYAALGGDYEGAREVNLEAADRPQDVYSRVLEIVKQKVQQESESSSAHSEVARLVLPVLSRKVVKQTVMTHVYGVTYVGAREQIANRLRDIDTFPENMVFRTATYLAQQVLGAVRELFTSAHEIQDWLGGNATRITRAIVTDSDLREVDSKFVSSVIWTTPLGLPIVQPYRQEKRKQVKTELQTVYITDPYSFQGVNARKQRMAFPPNYIHSLDASHMLMSALSSSERGIAFAAVHDSYWTHACDIEVMNKTLRECFVELHNTNLIERLKEEFQQRYGSHLEVVNIPADSVPARKIKDMYKAFAAKKYGRSLKLTISDQLEMELNASPEEETPVRVMKALSETEVEQLCAEALLRDKLKPKKLRDARSTEHAGTGLETLQEQFNALEEEEVETADAVFEDADAAPDTESAPKSKRAPPNTLSVLLPLRIPDVPARGTFDVKKVLDSPYFFS